MDAVRETDNTQAMKAGLASAIDYLVVYDSAGDRAEPRLAAPFPVTQCSLARAPVTACAVVLFLLSCWEFRRAGASVQASKRSTVICEQFPTGSVAISFIWLSFCSYLGCPFG